jgi:hypothetical protein
MKVTIEVQEKSSYFAVLNKWASVSRTLNEAQRLLQLMEDSGLFGDEADSLARNLDELNDLEPALNWLHQTVRSEIWNEIRKVIR